MNAAQSGLRVIAAAAILALSQAARADGLPKGFVLLRDIDASIVQDMRYAGHDNFVGRPLPGYDAAQCVLTRAAAEALKKVQSDLASQNISLKVFDCYRPVRAVRAMVKWVGDKSGVGDARYFPRTKKGDLIRQGYIASRSGHSTGSTVDLTLTRILAVAAAAGNGDALSSCLSQAEETMGNIDMGTRFDCFDPKSATASSEVAPPQRQWRNMLVAAMARHGFQNYAREWWHFSLQGGSAQAFDVPIR